jgi:SAM-dependent methyltransferase
VSSPFAAPSLEVGVGTGRVATALGIDLGVDPAVGALARARLRGVRAVAARGEALPFADGTFGLVVLSATLCFARDPAALLRDARRVLRDAGRVVVGVVAKESPWGRRYEQWGHAGHHFYSLAHLYTIDEVRTLLAGADLTNDQTRATLWGDPEDVGDDALVVAEPDAHHHVAEAGYVAFGARGNPVKRDLHSSLKV